MDLATKAKLAEAAKTLAAGHQLVNYRNTLYMPQDWRTRQLGPAAPEDTVWSPMTRADIRNAGNHLQGILFASDSEITSYTLMLKQFAQAKEDAHLHLLVNKDFELYSLGEAGQLLPPTGQFTPNFIQTAINDDISEKTAVMATFSEWLNSEEEAASLLRHLSTALSPSWTAVKYVLLLGDGRNGKSLMLSMLNQLLGVGNVSNITRQQIAERLPVVTELNGKLANIVFDGSMEYIKDSSMEKTLTAGEPAQVRLLYENGTTEVRTNALFLEALQTEPRTRDKSGALQKRLSRFHFPNVYPLDHEFEREMLQQSHLGALLSLLLDNFVREDGVAAALQQTKTAVQLQVDQALLNSPVLQYLQYALSMNPSLVDKFIKGGVDLDHTVSSFMGWRMAEGYTEYSSADVRRMFQQAFLSERKSIREGAAVKKKYFLSSPKPETLLFLQSLKEETKDEQPELPIGLYPVTVVDNGPL